MCDLARTGVGKWPRLVGFCVISITLTACGGGNPEGGQPSAPPMAAASEAAESTTDAANEITAASSASGQDSEGLTLALTSGNVSHLDDSAVLEEALLLTIDEAQNLFSTARQQIFNLDQDGHARDDGSSLVNLDWNPTHDTALLNPTFATTIPLLTTNSVTQADYSVTERTIAALGEDNARFIVMGSNPMRNYRRDESSLNEEMHLFLENSMSWLTQRDDLKTAPFSVVIAQMSDSYYFPDAPAVREWLDTRFPDQANYNKAHSCDDQQLSSCVTLGTDLLIISQHQDTEIDQTYAADAVKAAMQLGVPVLYLHHDGGMSALGEALLPIFNVSYHGDNYWRKLSLSQYDVTANGNELPADIQSVRTMIQHFLAEDYLFDWSACDGENCSEVVNLQTDFQQGADYVRELMTSLDQRKINLFDQNQFRFEKLLALLGDYYRQNVVFPMDKITTADTTFLKALFADHAVYQYRAINPAQSDLGTFSRSDFSSVIPRNRRMQLGSKNNFRSTGAYALPGQTVTVTRHDESEVGLSVFVNTVRAGSTHEWADNGYTRPKFLKGQAMSIEPGETIAFTSAYGGPLQLGFDTNDLTVDITFENIGEHPYWRSSEDDQAFANGLHANEYDWTELATPSFEVHSKTDKMQESVLNPVLGNEAGVTQALVAATVQYIHNYPHVLAGFEGPGIDTVDEIHDFASSRQLDIDNLDLVKHMNADQASCGYGCSGNPYDAYWSFNPVGHGDIHELGHGLEKFRLRFNQWPVHAMTNMYSYYSKTRYFKNTGREPDCQALPFESNYQILQSSLAASDPYSYLQSNLWNDMAWSEGAAMFIQMMMSAQDSGALIDGWHLLARLHILERAFQRATSNNENWVAARTSLGLDSLNIDRAKELSQNDWLLVAVSVATGFDHRAYFGLWGHEFSADIDAQLASMNLPAMALNYYVSSATGYCKGEGFDGRKLPIDGLNRSWPAE